MTQVEVDPKRLAASAKDFEAKADECDALADRCEQLLGPVMSGADPGLAILQGQVSGTGALVVGGLRGIGQMLRGTGDGLVVSAQMYSDTDAGNVDRAQQVAAAAAAIDDAAGSGGGASGGGAGTGDGRAGGSSSGDGEDSGGFDWTSTGSGTAVGVTHGVVDGLGTGGKSEGDGKSGGGGDDKGGGLSASTHSSTGGHDEPDVRWTSTAEPTVTGKKADGEQVVFPAPQRRDVTVGGEPDVRSAVASNQVVGKNADGEDVVFTAPQRRDVTVGGEPDVRSSVASNDVVVRKNADGEDVVFAAPQRRDVAIAVDSDGTAGGVLTGTIHGSVGGQGTGSADWKAGDPPLLGGVTATTHGATVGGSVVEVPTSEPVNVGTRDEPVMARAILVDASGDVPDVVYPHQLDPAPDPPPGSGLLRLDSPPFFRDADGNVVRNAGYVVDDPGSSTG